MGPFLMKNVMVASHMAALAVTPDLVLGTNDGKNHPQCKQHYQEDRSQEDKRDVEKGLTTGMER
jgi:hypothetical protein